MATLSTTVQREQLLRAQHVREAIRDAGNSFAPDHVARFLRDSFLEPTDDDAVEVATLLKGLADTARERLRDAGIELPESSREPVSRLSKRERDHAANLSTLLTRLSVALQVAGRETDALDTAQEAIAWAKRAGDHDQEAQAWRATGGLHDHGCRYNEMYLAMENELEAARKSQSPVRLIEALVSRVSMLTSQRRYDDVERAVAEAMEFLETSVPEEHRHPHYAVLLMRSGQVMLSRNQTAEALQHMREALQWTDPALFPMTRGVILSRITDTYLNLSQYRQCIECQQEVVQLAEAMGSNMVRAWGYFRLAYTHGVLKEHDREIELLDIADAYAPAHVLELKVVIAGRRADALLRTGDLDAAVEIRKQIIETIGDHPLWFHILSAYGALGDIELQRNRPEEAERHYRHALGIAERLGPGYAWTMKVHIADALQQLDRFDESAALLDEPAPGGDLHLTHQAKVCRLRAALAERRGDMRAVVEYEREAFAVDRMLLERQAEQSLRNARVMAQIELLEREAELERERRRRVERELADAVVALGDRKRAVATAEQRLRTALTQGNGTTERAVATALREALTTLKSGAQTHETPLQYLAGVDEEFFVRLRRRFPDLTGKQERLCGLLRAGLASKEIATLMELEPEGLKALRKRLRRALGIDETQRLEKVIAEI